VPQRIFTPFPVLKTQRLVLRQLTPGDDQEIFLLRSDENINRYLDRKPAKSIEDARKFIKNINTSIQTNDSIYWGISLDVKQPLIGTVCLFDFSADNSKAEIGYELLPGFQRQGIMQEAVSIVIDYALNQLKLIDIEAVSHSENQHSVRLLEKFNFKMNKTGDNNFIIYILNAGY
jgi:ribosomal-protein-alanine N-acetyltransferase